MRRSRVSDFAAGVILLVLAGAITYLGFTKGIPFRSHYEVKLATKDANGTRKGTPVRIAGVDVGTVVGLENGPPSEQSAVMTLRIKKKGRPIKEDARAAIRPRIFLEGNTFIDLQPGSPSAKEMPDGGMIPATRVRTPVQLDQVLTALQSDARDDLRVVLDEYGRSLRFGGAEALNRGSKFLEPAFRPTAQVADAFRGENGDDLSSYIESSGAVAEALDKNPEALKSLVSDLNTTFTAFAREDDQLRSALRELPRTLSAGQPALRELNDAFPPVRRLVADLRPAVRSSLPTIEASLPFVRQLRGAVGEDELRGLSRDLRATVGPLARASRKSVASLEETRKLASCTNEVLTPFQDLRVGDEVFPAERNVLEEAPKALVGLAGESRTGDANGQWFRILAAGGTNLVNFGAGKFAVSQFPINGVNPPADTRPPNRPEVPCETQELPNLDAKPQGPPTQSKVDYSDPALLKDLAKAQEKAVDWLKEDLDAKGLADDVKVATEALTRPQLDSLLKSGRAGR